MTRPEVFFAYFPGELSDDDRVALDRPGFKLYENGVGFSNPVWLLEGCSGDAERFHVVRVPAKSAIEARDKVVHALGRAPRDLKVWDPSE